MQRINELVRGKRGVTPETAWLLSQALNTTPEFWLNLQASYDLARHRPAKPYLRPLRGSALAPGHDGTAQQAYSKLVSAPEKQRTNLERKQ